MAIRAKESGEIFCDRLDTQWLASELLGAASRFIWIDECVLLSKAMIFERSASIGAHAEERSAAAASAAAAVYADSLWSA